MTATATTPGRSGPRGVLLDRLLDPGLAVLSFALFTLPVMIGATSGHGSVLDLGVLGALAAGCLIPRRRLPVAALVAVTVIEVFASLAGVRFTPFVSNAGPVVAIAVFTVFDQLPRRPALRCVAPSVLVMCVAAVIARQVHPAQDQDFVQLLVAIPAALLGDIRRTRRETQRRFVDEARARADEHDARVRAEERLRVSRDVHDIVSHTLSMIAVRAGVARLLLDTRPDEAHSALTAIEAGSRTALDELRAVLRQTRADPAPTTTAEPVLADADALLADARAAGLAVDFRVIGQPRHYDPFLETSAFRVLQEALTNVVKHAHASTVSIEIEHDPAELRLRLRVADDGRGADATGNAGPGFGLQGMRERTELFDGALQAGPRSTGGFAVQACFPTPEPEPTPGTFG